MTPTPTPRQEAKNQTASPRIFLFVRARRILSAVSLVLLAFAGTAAALPALPVGVPAMPAMPETPTIDQSVDTQVGTTSVYADNGQVDVCTKDAASTAMTPAASLPALPVDTPELPVSTDAGAAADLCAHANANDRSASLDGGAAAYGADQKASAKLGAEADKSGAGLDGEAHTGFFDAVIHWFQGLF